MTEPQWILEQTAFGIHSEQIAEHGGAKGVRDHTLLQSAMDSPKNLWSYGNANIFQLAAAYAYKICNNHPFNDGNKRTSYVVSILFLEINGYELVAADQDCVTTWLDLAQGIMTEEDLASWLQVNCKQA